MRSNIRFGFSKNRFPQYEPVGRAVIAYAQHFLEVERKWE
jgi:hypothetical protein